MNIITKEMCVIFLKDHYNQRFISAPIITAFILIVLWFVFQEAVVLIVAGAVFIPLLVFCLIKTKRMSESVDLKRLYLTGDTVVKFKKRLRLCGRSKGTRHEYSYEFKEYGKYEVTKSIYPEFKIPLHRETHIKHSDVDKLSAEPYEKGDMFYLLIYEEMKKSNIKNLFQILL